MIDRLGEEASRCGTRSAGAAAVAFQLALDHPELVGKLVLASFSYRLDGLHPGLTDNIGQLQPEHLAGGVIGDLAGLPRSRLAVLPGTTHVTLVQRSDWLASMVGEFLDAEVS
jgi:pimeloyl-ACP methyl ester carboxylesterase